MLDIEHYTDLLEDVKKDDTPKDVLKSLALETIHTRFPEQQWLHIFTDGSLLTNQIGANAGATCRLFSFYKPLGFGITNFDGEVEAICTTLQNLLYRIAQFQQAVILSDSKAAILAITSTLTPKSQQILECWKCLPTLIRTSSVTQQKGADRPKTVITEEAKAAATEDFREVLRNPFDSMSRNLVYPIGNMELDERRISSFIIVKHLILKSHRSWLVEPADELARLIDCVAPPVAVSGQHSRNDVGLPPRLVLARTWSHDVYCVMSYEHSPTDRRHQITHFSLVPRFPVAGFKCHNSRKGRGTRGAIDLLRTIGERYLEKNNDVRSIRRLRKGFDRADRNKLMRILKEIDESDKDDDENRETRDNDGGRNGETRVTMTATGTDRQRRRRRRERRDESDEDGGQKP
ncbi:hypothetical protein ANN_26193 [Periplaneta americana]|uniref:RNase H type-1 domain-containing protein n=1 Tax=Periplaneta americana TaxID=6978 RepID=A0ABQ8S5L4_PERAM|nr:hypothetical protein ANN_26193 [Periplaneta americana]